MRWDQVEGTWTELRGSMRQHWGQLTDDDLEVIAGTRDQFVCKLQERYGMSHEEAQRRADNWVRNLSGAAPLG
jgi:uncharacterized protein YjbJ (UPF0337 family)